MNDAIDFVADKNNDIVPFKFKEKITGKTDTDGTKDIDIMVALKYLSNFWLLVAAAVANQVPIFAITDKKAVASVKTLSTQDNTKLLQHLKSCFKRTINWNKYQAKVSMERPKQYLDYFRFSRNKQTFCFII